MVEGALDSTEFPHIKTESQQSTIVKPVKSLRW